MAPSEEEAIRKYFLLGNEIPVTIKKANEQTEIKKATIIDFQNPENNYSLAIKELKIYGELYRNRHESSFYSFHYLTLLTYNKYCL